MLSVTAVLVACSLVKVTEKIYVTDLAPVTGIGLLLCELSSMLCEKYLIWCSKQLPALSGGNGRNCRCECQLVVNQSLWEKGLIEGYQH